MLVPFPREQDLISVYLDLMKQCLLDYIYIDDPLSNFVEYKPKPTTKPWKRQAIAALAKFLQRYRIKLVEPYSIPWIEDVSRLSEAELKGTCSSPSTDLLNQM